MIRRLACTVLLLSGTAAAQSSARGALILALPTSPRALGLADAAGVASPDSWALFTAPAALASLRGLGIALASEAYLVSTQLSAGVVTVPLHGGTIALGATLLDYGSIQEIASTIPGADGTETGRTYHAQDNAIVMGYARAFGAAGIRLGATIEFVNTRVAELSASGVAGSAGVAWSPRAGWDLGATVQHAGEAIALGATKGELPLTVRLSAAAPARRVRGFDVRPLLEARSVRGGGNAVAGAAEADWRRDDGVGLALRAGYVLRADAADDRWPFAGGVGVSLGAWTLDYAVERFETIDQFTHRVGVRYARRGSTTAAR